MYKYVRNRYKSSVWRKNAASFIRKNFTGFKVRAMLQRRGQISHKVGWSAKNAQKGKARRAQNRWRRNYYNKYNKVI